jgi:hypothetical protein
MYKLHALPRIMRFDETLPVVREDLSLGDGVVIVDGKQVKRDPKKLWIRANVQPVAGRDLIQEPEGDRFTEQFTLYSRDPICTDDKIMRSAKVYQVQKTNDWGSYWSGIMMLVDTDPNAPSEFDNMPEKPKQTRRLF